jgi:hypothetical protein
MQTKVYLLLPHHHRKDKKRGVTGKNKTVKFLEKYGKYNIGEPSSKLQASKLATIPFSIELVPNLAPSS